MVINKIGAQKNSETKNIIIIVSQEADYEFDKLAVEELSP